jgi:ornithine cyclodeaminase/alanine dehydrogenase-like protein (mu-crystallin family)
MKVRLLLEDEIRGLIGPAEALGEVAEQAVEGCQVVVTATPAREPIVRAAWVRPGTHVTAVGSDGPEKQELEAALPARADKAVASSPVASQTRRSRSPT